MSQKPLTRDELNAIRDGHKRNDDVKALLREIRRQNDLMIQIEEIRQSIERCWKDEVGGNLTALHSLRLLLQDEIDRFVRTRR